MNFQTEIETLIRARYPILYIITSEEMRVQNILVEIAAKPVIAAVAAGRRTPTF